MGEGEDIAWSCGKFVVGRDGEVVANFEPQTTPDTTTLKATIAKALG